MLTEQSMCRDGLPQTVLTGTGVSLRVDYDERAIGQATAFLSGISTSRTRTVPRGGPEPQLLHERAPHL